MGEKIIFLDTNGVLNFGRHRQEELKNRRTLDLSKMKLSREAMGLVGKLVKDSKAKVVCTSSWRNKEITFKNLSEQLSNYSVEIFDITPHLGFEVTKEEEIKSWIENNKQIDISKYVIIDDLEMEDLASNLVLCNRDFGFTTKELYTKAYEILNV